MVTCLIKHGRVILSVDDEDIWGSSWVTVQNRV